MFTDVLFVIEIIFKCRETDWNNFHHFLGLERSLPSTIFHIEKQIIKESNSENGTMSNTLDP